MISMLLTASLLVADPTATVEAAPAEATPTVEATTAVEATLTVEAQPAEAQPAEAQPAEAKPAKPPKPSPEERLAHLDEARVEMHIDVRGLGRYLGGPSTYGGTVQLGAGVRLVRGLYVIGELGAGAHAMPLGFQGQVLMGLRHELRMSKWVRPSYSLAYSHLIDVKMNAEFDPICGCMREHEGVGVGARGDVSLDQRNGLQAGLGLRFPFRWAPRLSAYLRADVAYYFDDAPGRLQAGGGGGLQVVF